MSVVHDEWEENPPVITINGSKGLIQVKSVRLRDKHQKIVTMLHERIVRELDEAGLMPKLASSSDDLYVIGYLAGLVDGLCQSGGIRGGRQPMGMVERLYHLTFQNGDWTKPRNTLSRFQGKSKELDRGLREGGQAFLDFDDKVIPVLAGELQLYLSGYVSQPRGLRGLIPRAVEFSMPRC